MWFVNFQAGDESAPTRLATVAERLIAAHRTTHGGMQPIGTDQ